MIRTKTYLFFFFYIIIVVFVLFLLLDLPPSVGHIREPGVPPAWADTASGHATTAAAIAGPKWHKRAHAHLDIATSGPVAPRTILLSNRSVLVAQSRAEAVLFAAIIIVAVWSPRVERVGRRRRDPRGRAIYPV